MTIHALKVTESDLERAEERGEMGETKIMELEEELKVKMMMMVFFRFHFQSCVISCRPKVSPSQVVATNLKSLEVAEEKANQREVNDQMMIMVILMMVFMTIMMVMMTKEYKNHDIEHSLIKATRQIFSGKLQGADQDLDGKAEASRSQS